VITMTSLRETRGIRLRVESVVPDHAPGWKRCSPVRTFGGRVTDNNTGVSDVECRHR
jgi:hypothetical protein